MAVFVNTIEIGRYHEEQSLSHSAKEMHHSPCTSLWTASSKRWWQNSREWCLFYDEIKAFSWADCNGQCSARATTPGQVQRSPLAESIVWKLTPRRNSNYTLGGVIIFSGSWCNSKLHCTYDVSTCKYVRQSCTSQVWCWYPLER